MQAFANGRHLTLDKPISRKQLAIEAREVEPEEGLACGLQQMWVEGELGKEEFRLTCGAGVGSRWLKFMYRKRVFVMDCGDIVQAMLDYAEAT